MPTFVPEGILSHEIAIGGESADGENIAFQSIDGEVQEKSKVYFLEITTLPALSMQDHGAEQVTSPNLPLFSTRAPVLAEIIFSPITRGDDSDGLSKFFEDQFQKLDGLIDTSTPVLPTFSTSRAAKQDISFAMPSLNMTNEDAEGQFLEDENVENVDFLDILLMFAEGDIIPEPPREPFTFKRASSHKVSAARPPLNANWVPDTVTLEGIAERKAQKSDPRCECRLEPNGFKAKFKGKLEPVVDKDSIAKECGEFKETPIEEDRGVLNLELKNLKKETRWAKVKSKKRKRDGSEEGHSGDPRKAKKSSRKSRSKRRRGFTENETLDERKGSKN